MVNDTLENLQECLNLLSLTQSISDFEKKKRDGKLVEFTIGTAKYWYDIEEAEAQRKFHEALERKMFDKLFLHGMGKD